VKIHLFESEPWIKTAWQSTGSPLEVIWVEGMLTPDIARMYDDAEIISSDMSILSEALLKQFKQLKLIAVRSTGVDQIDLDYCSNQKITVCNVPAYAQNAVAEHVFALLLAIGRHIVETAQRTKKFDFSWTGIQAFELRGKTLAVIGTGAIGRRVAMIARGFGMEVAAFDKFPDNTWAIENGVRYMSVEDALSLADVVTLHVPGAAETRNLLSEERFGLMKDGVVIINTSRGDVMDSGALLRALAGGKVAAAGLDVLPGENRLLQEDARIQTLQSDRDDLEMQIANHLLLQHPRVIVTPHCAFYTKEAAQRLLEATVGNIDAFVRGTPRNVRSTGTHFYNFHKSWRQDKKNTAQ